MAGKLFAACIVAMVVGVGCSKSSTPTSIFGPSRTSAQLLSGTWSSVTSNSPNPAAAPSSCNNFTWTVTELTATSGSGSFAATCFGNIQVTGTGRGTLAGSTINWSAHATGTAPGTPSCAIALTGTAQFQGTELVLSWNGTTCNGPVSGMETLKKA